jgi:hypothetical protein
MLTLLGQQASTIQLGWVLEHLSSVWREFRGPWALPNFLPEPGRWTTAFRCWTIHQSQQSDCSFHSEKHTHSPIVQNRVILFPQDLDVRYSSNYWLWVKGNRNLNRRVVNATLDLFVSGWPSDPPLSRRSGQVRATRNQGIDPDLLPDHPTKFLVGCT